MTIITRHSDMMSNQSHVGTQSSKPNLNMAQVFGDTYQRNLAAYDEQVNRVRQVTDQAIAKVAMIFDKAQTQLSQPMAPEQAALLLVEVRKASLDVPQNAVQSLEPYFKTEQALLTIYTTQVMDLVNNAIQAREKQVLSELKLRETAWKLQVQREFDVIAVDTARDKREIGRLELVHKEEERAANANEDLRHKKETHKITENHTREMNHLTEEEKQIQNDHNAAMGRIQETNEAIGGVVKTVKTVLTLGIF